MMPAAKMFDPLLGVDIHMVQPPGPVPPLPIPHPYIGFLLDPMEFIPMIGATTLVTGLPRGQAGTTGQAMPPHIPIGGMFVKPPSNESEMFMGSAIVTVEQEPFSYLALPALSCQDIGMPAPPRVKRRKPPMSLMLPLTFVLCIPGPVFIGGPPTIGNMAFLSQIGLGKLVILMAVIESGGDPMALLGLVAGSVIGKLQGKLTGKLGGLLGKLKGKGGKGKGGKNGRGPATGEGTPSGNGNTCNGTTPVNTFTGEYWEPYLDAKAGGEALFEWRRHYTSARHRELGVCGKGFRHAYDQRLTLYKQAYRLETFQRQMVYFAPVSETGDTTATEGYVLTRTSPNTLTLARTGDPTMHFVTRPGGAPRLVELVQGPRKIALEYAGEYLVALVETVVDAGWQRPVARYELQYGQHGLLYGVSRLDTVTTPQDPLTPGGAGAGYRRTVLASYEYDGHGQMTRSTNAMGGVHTLRYDADGRVVSFSDPRGYSFSFAYDQQGRCIDGRGEDGQWWAKFKYSPDGLETHIQEVSQGWHIHRFNRRGRLLEVEDPYGGLRKREIDPKTGLVTREVDSGGREMLWLYDHTGLHYARRNHVHQLVPTEEDAGFLPDPLAPKLPKTAIEREFGWALKPGVALAPSAMLLGGVTPETAQLLSPHVSRLPSYPLARKPRHTYDELGNTIETIQPSGKRWCWKYDASANLIESRDADGKVSRREIVRWNLVGAEVDPIGNATRYEFTDNEYVRTVLDPLGNETTYEYDDKDRLTRIARNGVTEEALVYDVGDRLVEKRDANGNALLRFEYDDRSLVSHVILADGSEHFQDHDEFGKPTLASTSDHQVELLRDEYGRILADLVDGVGVVRNPGHGTSTFFGKFRFRHATYEATVSRSGQTHLVVVRDPTGKRHRVEHDPSGLVRRETAAGSVELVRYNDEGHVDARIVERQTGHGGVHWSRFYRRSAEGDVLSVQDSAFGSTEYEVDDAHRIIAERGPQGDFSYIHDDAGNLLEGSELRGGKFGSHNCLLEANGLSYRYNARLHIAEAHDPVTGRSKRYAYNARDMLTRVEVGHYEGGDWVDDEAPWSAEYDALGRRLTSGREGQRKHYYWNDRQLAAEVAEDGRLRIYMYASEQAWVPLFFVDYADVEADPRSGKVYSIFSNHLGVPIAVEDDSGSIVWRARRVAPFGQVDIEPDSQIELNLRWPGHYFDPETGLHYNRYRYYDPRLGRYLQTDPAGQRGGINVYAYSPNPLRDVDLLGLHDGKTGRSGEGSGDTNPSKNAPKPGDPLPKPATPKTPPDSVAVAREKQARSEELGKPHGEKTVASNGGDHLSGYDVDGTPTPKGFESSGRDPQRNLAHEEQIGHTSNSNASTDPRVTPDGKVTGAQGRGGEQGETLPGGAASTHAERQSAMAQNEQGINDPIGVSRDQCGNCRGHNKAHAQDPNRPGYPDPVVVADPNHTRVYNSDGTVDVYDKDGNHVGTAPKDHPPTTNTRPRNVPW